MTVRIRTVASEPPTKAPLVDSRDGTVTGTWQVYFTLLARELARSVLGSDDAVNPPSLGSGATTQTVFALPGAEVGGFATASFAPPNGGIVLLAAVTAAGQVTVTFWNVSGGTIDLPQGTLRVEVRNP